MITVDSKDALISALQGLDIPNWQKRSLYFDCTRGYSWEAMNEPLLDAVEYHEVNNLRVPRKWRFTPPLTHCLGAESITVTGPLLEEMRNATMDRRRRAR